MKYISKITKEGETYLVRDEEALHSEAELGLAAVAKSGSYNDLLDKPTIPDTTGLATEGYVANAVANGKVGMASEAYVNEAIAGIDIPSIEGLATETYVNQAVAGVVVPTKVSELTNDSGYQTESGVNTLIDAALSAIGVAEEGAY